MPSGSAECYRVFFFCLLLQLRALLETCKMASLSERFTFSPWLFAFYEFQSIALRQYSSLYAHNPLFSSQQKRKSEHIKLHNLSILPIDTHNMGHVTNYLTCTAMTQFCKYDVVFKIFSGICYITNPMSQTLS